MSSPMTRKFMSILGRFNAGNSFVGKDRKQAMLAGDESFNKFYCWLFTGVKTKRGVPLCQQFHFFGLRDSVAKLGYWKIKPWNIQKLRCIFSWYLIWLDFNELNFIRMDYSASRTYDVKGYCCIRISVRWKYDHGLQIA